MDNSTMLRENDGPLDSPGFLAFSILLAVIILVCGLMMIFTVVALLEATSVPGTLRLFLTNLLFAGLLLALAVMLAVCTLVVLISVSSNIPRPQYLCRL